VTAGAPTLVRLTRPRLTADGAIVVRARPARGGSGRLAARLADRATTIPARAAATTLTIDAGRADDDAVDALATPGGRWVEFRTYIAAYDLAGGCEGEFNKDGGYCVGKFTDPSSTVPFAAMSSDTRGEVHFGSSMWFKAFHDDRDRSVTSGLMEGTLSSPDSAALTIHYASFFGPVSMNFDGTGNDPALVGKQGGPLYLDVKWHFPYPLGEGYSFDLHGWLWCNDCR
jgi:hypothetical protein